MFKKILYGIALIKLTAVLGVFIGAWALALPIGLIVGWALQGNALGEGEPLEQKREDLSDIDTYDLSDTDAYVITGEWGYGSKR